MEIITKHYVEIYFPEYAANKCAEFESYKSVVKTISERKPLVIGNDNVKKLVRSLEKSTQNN